MNLYPAIDLFEGKVVRLSRGDYDRMTVYSEDPSEVARRWESQGAGWLHVIDLEGARAGEIRNEDSLRRIRKETRCRVQFGGGLRTMEAIERVLALGVSRIILGTRALEEDFLREAVERFGPAVAVSLDAQDGRVRTEGWLSGREISLPEAVRIAEEQMIGTLITTDIKKDGMLQGPNLESLSEILAGAKAQVILAGGIAGLEDIRRCAAIRHPHFDGIIVGKALFEPGFSLSQALRIAREAQGV
ncbi:MAG: 1-(5-phosphoribosyl)-5-[(5-phosphoribosylamino)methylideneamino]imidazole-4-carboxamide isomerase [Candidatus Omnitrophota bacterium]|jgi:phosphoribosylformimino-5-aminoimidazole carboxamide ribotide isomerase